MRSNLNLNLNWLRTFEAAARLSGFSAAGRELGLTQVAVSQQIKALETKLGHDLFVRHAKKVQLTHAGKAYLLSVREGLENLAHATYGLFGADINRTIVVRASIAVLTWLTPRLSRFRQQYPKIRLKFVTSIWPDPVDTQKIDIDIVLASSNKRSAPSEKLSDEFIVPVCGIGGSKHISSPQDLLKLESIQILGFDDHWSHYMSYFEVQQDSNRSSRLQVDSSVLACELVAAGVGCAVVIERFAKTAIEMGRPICMVGEPLPLHQSHFLVKRNSINDEPILAEIEAFKEWIHAEFTDSELTEYKA
jgi:LysR family transcriptional regulator, glycine cleavage system transcriptional activator